MAVFAGESGRTGELVRRGACDELLRRAVEDGVGVTVRDAPDGETDDAGPVVVTDCWPGVGW
ncbi:MAG: hypothetical protein ACK5MP_11375 [Nostocoides sp.]